VFSVVRIPARGGGRAPDIARVNGAQPSVGAAQGGFVCRRSSLLDATPSATHTTGAGTACRALARLSKKAHVTPATDGPR